MDTYGIAGTAMSMSAMQFETAYSTAMLKKSMEGMEQEALSLIEAMEASVPAPAAAAGHIDTYI